MLNVFLILGLGGWKIANLLKTEICVCVFLTNTRL